MKSLQNNSLSIKTPHFVHNLPISIPFHLSIPKSFPSLFSNLQTKCLKSRVPNLLKIKLFNSKTPTLFDLSASYLPLMVVVSIPSPCLAAGTEEMSPKINIESILVSIDDFFNRYPYFVASLAFVWLVAIPLTQEYLNKYKFISAIDAFRKLRDEPGSQLLDIRKKHSVAYLKTPNLKILNKVAVSLVFVEGCEEEFIKEVLKSFENPGNTTLCVLDNFDGNSLKVAKLLFENGFKEVYAIKGGVQGKDGWQAIQEKLLPPSVHVYPKKKSRASSDQDDERREGNEEHEENRQILTSSSRNQEAIQNIENGYTKSRKSSSTSHVHGKPLSPYPNFKDLKPPSSPTPSKP